MDFLPSSPCKKQPKTGLLGTVREGATRKMSPHFKGARGVLAAPAAAGRPRGVPGFGLRRRLPPGAFPVPPGREMRAP